MRRRKRMKMRLKSKKKKFWWKIRRSTRKNKMKTPIKKKNNTKFQANNGSLIGEKKSK